MPNSTLSRHSRALGVLTTLSLAPLALVGCKDKAPDATAQAQAPTRAVAPGAESSTTASRSAKGLHDAQFPTAIPTFRHGDGVFGHILLNDVSNLLAELGQVAPPAHKGKFDEGALRALAAMALEQRGVIAQNINLKAPMGCALLDLKKYPDAPTACAIGYKGGATALVRDLGAQNKLEDAKGHLAAYDLEGKTLFIDDLSSHAAISIYPGAFAEAREYLDANIVKRSAGLTGNVEATLFIRSLIEKYPEEVKPLLDQFDSQTGSEQSKMIAKSLYPNDDAAATKLAAAIDEAQDMSAGSQGENLKNSTQATLTIGLHGWGLQLGGAIVPSEGSDLLSYAKLADQSASREISLELPATADMFMSGYQSPASWKSEPMARNINSLCGVWAALTSAPDSGVCTKAFNDFNAALEPTNTGQSVVFHAPKEGSILGSVGAILRTTGNRRELFVSTAKSVSIQTLLGARAAESVSYTFEADKRNHDGVPVDRMTLAMTDELKGRLRSDAKDVKDTDRVLMERLLSSNLVIERAEFDKRIVMSVTVGGDEAFTNNTIDVAKGKGERVDAAAINAIFNHHPQSQSIGAANPQAFVDIVRSIAKLDATNPESERMLAQLPTDLATDLATMRMYSELLPSGTGSIQALIDADFLADAVNRVMKASQGRAAGGDSASNGTGASNPF